MIMAKAVIRLQMPGREFEGIVFLPEVQPVTLENCLPQIRSFSIAAVSESELTELSDIIQRGLTKEVRAA